ncbi:hypothetical protein QE152_g23265 [Popillia japonica]|uniref:Uncharacterized protein n=1 Tax=Popillia japonica TaxID=7064 RepID=A0AAW1KG23_POPJA
MGLKRLGNGSKKARETGSGWADGNLGSLKIRSGCDANHGSVHGGHDGSQTESRGRWRGTRDDYCVSVPTH